MIHAESQAASKYYNGKNRIIVLEASSDVYAERGGEMRRLSPRIQYKRGQQDRMILRKIQGSTNSITKRGQTRRANNTELHERVQRTRAC